MIYDYIYGRLSDGYACINRDGLPFMNADFDQLKSLMTYEGPEDTGCTELPEEFYFYNEELSDGRVGIIGRTSFVPGGTGISGARDTSFSHKYIFTGEDYEGLLKDSSLIFKTREYFDSADGYNAGIKAVSFPGPEAAVLPDYIDKNRFVLLLYCCIEAFADTGRRVYVILPENDRQGTVTATAIMKKLLEAVPSFLLSNAGFLTYSPTFDSNTLNPVPNGVSVVFIRRNQENIYRSARASAANYVFDFSEQIYPSCEIDTKTFNTIYAMWTRENVREVINDFLYGIFVPGARIRADIFAHILVLARGLDTVEADRLLRDKCRAVLEIINSEAGSLAPDGISMLDGNVGMILQNCSFDSFYLDFIGKLYASTTVYRNVIVDTLANEACRRVFAASAGTEESACEETSGQYPDDDSAVLEITDFEYADEKLNDDLLVRAYSDENCYKIGEILFLASVEPVMLKQTLPMQDRIAKLLEFIGNNLIKDFGGFVRSFCTGYVEYYADYYLNEVCRSRAAACGITLPDRFGICSVPAGKARIDIAEAYFEAVKSLEKLMGQYVQQFDSGYGSFIGEFCLLAMNALEGDYRMLTAQENRELFEEWKKKYQI